MNNEDAMAGNFFNTNEDIFLYGFRVDTQI